MITLSTVTLIHNTMYFGHECVNTTSDTRLISTQLCLFTYPEDLTQKVIRSKIAILGKLPSRWRYYRFSPSLQAFLDIWDSQRFEKRSILLHMHWHDSDLHYFFISPRQLLFISLEPEKFRKSENG